MCLTCKQIAIIVVVQNALIFMQIIQTDTTIHLFELFSVLRLQFDFHN